MSHGIATSLAAQDVPDIDVATGPATITVPTGTTVVYLIVFPRSGTAWTGFEVTSDAPEAFAAWGGDLSATHGVVSFVGRFAVGIDEFTITPPDSGMTYDYVVLTPENTRPTGGQHGSGTGVGAPVAMTTYANPPRELYWAVKRPAGTPAPTWTNVPTPILVDSTATGDGGVIDIYRRAPRFDSLGAYETLGPSLTITGPYDFYCFILEPAISYLAQPETPWTVLAGDRPGGPLYGTLAVANAGTIYTWDWNNKAYFLDTATGVWTAGADLDPSVAVYGGVGFPVGGYLYLLTGNTNDVLKYDPATDTYVVLSDDPVAGNGPLGAALIGTVIYVVDSDGNLASYDTATDTWTTLAPVAPVMPGGAADGGLAEVGGVLYYLNGWDDSVDGLMASYDIATDTWTFDPDVPADPFPSEDLIVVGVGTKILVVGGDDTSDESALGEVRVYDTVAHAWSTAPYSTGRTAQGWAISDGDLYVINGYLGGSAGYADTAFVEKVDVADLLAAAERLFDHPIEITVSTVPVSPGVLSYTIANGPPSGVVDLLIDGVIADTVTLDATGYLRSNLTVTVGVGEHILSIEDDTYGGSSAFDVLTLAAGGGGGGGTPPDYTPPTVNRWQFQDPVDGSMYEFPINPDDAAAPTRPRNISERFTTSGRPISHEGAERPFTWTFRGTVLTEAQYDAFVLWAAKKTRLWVTDDLGRRYEVYLRNFAHTPVKPSSAAGLPYYGTYVMTTTCFRVETP